MPRQWDANGHARGILAPGGWIARTDPDGKTWEIVSSGYRNSYDIAFNAEGELFAYDSDMEWDMGMPWYRPTRAVHATSGSEFGWRSGTGKWPALLRRQPAADAQYRARLAGRRDVRLRRQVPAQISEGPLPLRLDLRHHLRLHLEPHGSTYKAVKEEFLSRTPLPLTDAAVGPDGALVFHDRRPGDAVGTVPCHHTRQGVRPSPPTRANPGSPTCARCGGRSNSFTASERPRKRSPIAFIHFSGTRPLHPVRGAGSRSSTSRRRSGKTVCLAETDPEALITGAVALARQGDRSLKPQLIAALDRLDFAKLACSPAARAVAGMVARLYSLGRAWPETIGRPCTNYGDALPGRR